MANRAVQIAPAVALGLTVAALILGSAAMVALRADHFALAPADWAALRFTLLQAALSAGVSTVLAVPVARALFRRRFVGRGALIRLMSAPFVLPVVVAVLGLLAVFGRAGPINTALAALELPTLSIFGLHGVGLAHVFLNLPLAVRMLLHGWQSIPAERFRLAQSLGCLLYTSQLQDVALGDLVGHRLLQRGLLNQLVQNALEQRLIRQGLVLFRQAFAGGDHMAQRDVGAVDGGNHRVCGGVLGQNWQRQCGRKGHSCQKLHCFCHLTLS